MNKNVTALLSIGHAQLTNLRPVVSRNVKQSSIADLPAHLCVERRPIKNNVHFPRFFARQNSFDNRFRFEKIVTKEFSRLDFELAIFNTDFLLLLSLARAVTLLLHQSLELGNIDNKSSFPSHELCEIERKSVRVV